MSLKLQILKQLNLMQIRINQDGKNLLEQYLQQLEEPIDFLKQIFKQASPDLLTVEDVKLLILQNQPLSDFNIQQYSIISSFPEIEQLTFTKNEFAYSLPTKTSKEQQIANKLKFYSQMHSNLSNFEQKFTQFLHSQYQFSASSKSKFVNFNDAFTALKYPKSISYAENNQNQLISFICVLQKTYLQDGQNSISFKLIENLFSAQSYLYPGAAVLVLGRSNAESFEIHAIAPPLYDSNYIQKLQKLSNKLAIPLHVNPYILVIKTITQSTFPRFKKLLKTLPTPPSFIVIFNWSFASYGPYEMFPAAAAALQSANLLIAATEQILPTTKLILTAIPEISTGAAKVFPLEIIPHFKEFINCYIADDPFLLQFGKSRVVFSNFQTVQALRCESLDEQLDSKIFLQEHQLIQECEDFPGNQTVSQSARNIIAEGFLSTILQQFNIIKSSSFLTLSDPQLNFSFDSLVLSQDDLQQYNCKIFDKRCVILPDFGRGSYCVIGGCQGENSVAFYDFVEE